MLILNLTRGNSGLRVPLRFPATPAEIGAAYAKLYEISKNENETRIASVMSEVGFLDKFFKDKPMSYSGEYIDLNELARQIDRLTEQELRTLDGALKMESVGSITDILRIADSLNDYIFISGVTTEKDLGQFLTDSGYKDFPESVKPDLDYAAIGAEYCRERGGVFTPEGFTFLRRQEESLSAQEREWWKPLFRVYLQTPERQSLGREPYMLDLPATTEQLFAARCRLEVADLADAELIQTKCLYQPFKPYIPLQEPDFTELRDLSVNLSAAMDNYGESLVLAVYDMKRPQSLMQAGELALEIWRYELVTNVEGYGRNALYELCEDQEIVDTVDDYMDWDSFGRHMLEEDGLVFTEHGYIRLPNPEQPDMEQRAPSQGLQMGGILC